MENVSLFPVTWYGKDKLHSEFDEFNLDTVVSKVCVIFYLLPANYYTVALSLGKVSDKEYFNSSFSWEKYA